MNRLKKLGRLFDNVGRNFALQRGVYGQSFTGQLGKAVVGGTWKDKKTLRTYAVPTNPKTAGQVSQRGKFKISQVTASALLETIVKPYWNPFANSQSGFNAFIGLNSQRVTDNTDFQNIYVTSGSYEPVSVVNEVLYNATTGVTTFGWDGDPLTIGDEDDRSVLVLLDTTDYDASQKTPILLAATKIGATRITGADTLTIKSGLSIADIFGFVAFIQPAADPVLRVSNSTWKATELQ